MMGSRGDPSPQTAALATLVEIADLLRNADTTLPARLAEVHEAEAAGRAVWLEVEKGTAAQDARHKVLDVREVILDAKEANLANREAACAAREAETERKQGTFSSQTAALDERKRELDARATSVEKMLEASQQEISATREAIAKWTEKARSDIDQLSSENEAAMQDARDKAAAEIARMRAGAEASIAAARLDLKEREDRVAAREIAIHDLSTELRAALKE